jgi:hypothetical protein
MNQIAVRQIEGEIVERFEDYGIRIVVDSYVVNFEVKEIRGETLEPPPAGLWLYMTIDGATTTVFADGEMFLNGSINWNGSSNWDFNTAECMAYFCGRQQAVGIGRLIDHLYQITKERLPTYDASLAE